MVVQGPAVPVALPAALLISRFSCQAAQLVIELPPLDFIIHSGGC